MEINKIQGKIDGIERNLEFLANYAQINEKTFKMVLINIIDSNLTEKLSKMAKFRNVLVHSNGKVDNVKVLEYIKERLDDIKQFIGILFVFIKKEKRD